MAIEEGHGLLLKLPYADGGTCSKKRTFLVIDTDSIHIYLLNVSSINGKRRKLLMDSNELIRIFNPPFVKPSFIKLDAIYCLINFPKLQRAILNSGNKLDLAELKRLKGKFNIYKRKNRCITATYEQIYIQHNNANL